MKRIPFWLVGILFVPFQITSPLGPSMYPTMEPRGEIFVIDKYFFRLGFYYYYLFGENDDDIDDTSTSTGNDGSGSDGGSENRIEESIKVGDIVLVRKPSLSSSNGKTSTPETFPFFVDTHPRVIKRVMAVGGKKITTRDSNNENENENEGVTPSISTRSSSSSGSSSGSRNERNIPQLLPDQFWIEGDNPELSVDSRHYGPVSMKDVEGKIVWRLWPLHKFGTLGNNRSYPGSSST